MTGADIKSVLDFSAFIPEPDDPTASWKKRFPGRRTAILSIGKNFVNVYPLAKNGKPQQPMAISDVRDLKESLKQAAEEILAVTDGGWCAASINTRYVISLETNLSRRPGSEDIIKSNPRTVLGGRYEKGKRYAVTHNPETTSSVLLSLDEEFLGKIEAAFKEAGLKLGRICCGPYALLRHALTVLNNNPDETQHASAFLIVLCEGAVCALLQEEDKWVELRSRTDVFDAQDISAALDLLAPFAPRLPAGIPVLLCTGTTYPGIEEAVSSVFQGHAIQDISSQDLLLSVLSSN